MPALSPTPLPVEEFLESVSDARRKDAHTLCTLMQDITGEPPVMWGPSIVGFGTYHYRYASGHEGDAPLAAFAPRKQHLVVYLIDGYEDRYGKALARLGPYKSGKCCLYLKRLVDIDLDALRELIDRSARVAKGVDRT